MTLTLTLSAATGRRRDWTGVRDVWQVSLAQDSNLDWGTIKEFVEQTGGKHDLYTQAPQQFLDSFSYSSNIGQNVHKMASEFQFTADFSITDLFQEFEDWETKVLYISTKQWVGRQPQTTELHSGMVDFTLFFKWLEEHPHCNNMWDIGCGAACQLAVVVACIWAYDDANRQVVPHDRYVLGTELVFAKCVKSIMLLTALNCVIQHLRQ